MVINGFKNVKNYNKKEYPRFILYEYFLENGNVIRECYSKWVQTDFTTTIKLTPEEQIERHLDSLIDRR